MRLKKRSPTFKKPARAVAPVGLVPPAMLDAHEQLIWDELVKETPWLTRYDRFNLHMFVCALSRYQKDHKGASNALHNRLKSLGSKLRFDDPPKSFKLAPERTKASKFFDGEPESTDETRARMSREIGRKFFGDDEDEE